MYKSLAEVDDWVFDDKGIKPEYQHLFNREVETHYDFPEPSPKATGVWARVTDSSNGITPGGRAGTAGVTSDDVRRFYDGDETLPWGIAYKILVAYGDTPRVGSRGLYYREW